MDLRAGGKRWSEEPPHSMETAQECSRIQGMEFSLSRKNSHSITKNDRIERFY